MTSPVTFLFSDGDLTSARKLLLIQSGPPELLAALIEMVQKTFPSAEICALLQRGIVDAPPYLLDLPRVEFVENLGSKAGLVKRLLARAFDGVLVLYSNHPGYWKLKLLPYALGARTVLGVNENLGCFPISLPEIDRLSGHLLWRLQGASSITAPVPLGELARAVAAPLVLGYLFAHERTVHLRLRLRGSPARWKGGHEEDKR